MKYCVQYKCRHCGVLTVLNGKDGKNIVEMSQEDAQEFLNKIIRNQQFFGNPYLYQAPIYVSHCCKDGSVALADLVGIVKI